MKLSGYHSPPLINDSLDDDPDHLINMNLISTMESGGIVMEQNKYISSLQDEIQSLKLKLEVMHGQVTNN